MYIQTIPVIIYVLSYVKDIQGTLCYKCDGLPFTRECKTVQLCGSHEQCFVDLYVAANGEPYREMGCRDTQQCVSTVAGRKRGKRGRVQVCSECCTSPWCQTERCGQTGLPKDRGLICYQCDGLEPGHLCSTIHECSRDDICYESFTPTTLGRPVYKSGCFSRLGCQHSEQQIGHIPNHCFKCCNNDTCNTDCQTFVTNVPTKPTTPIPTTTTQSGFTTRPTGGPTIPGCADQHSPQLCKVLVTAGITCHNATMATNGGCLFTCGFCYVG